MQNLTALFRMLTCLHLVLFLVACQSPTPQSSPHTDVGNSTGVEFPETEIPNPIPEPKNGKSNIVGRIVGPDPIENIGLILYLGDLIVVDENQVGGFLDHSRAPRALFDPKSGEFVFQNVAPGEYSLVLYQVELGGQAYMAPDGTVETIVALPNETTNLGEITYE